MAKGGSKGLGCALALIGVVLLILLTIGVGTAVLLVMGPSMALDAMVEDAPSSFDHPASPKGANPILQSYADDLKATRTTRMTGPELTRLIQDELGDKGRGGIAISGGIATADLSVDLRTKEGEGGWVNLHAVGSFVMEDGWVTEANLSELDVSGWDLGSLMDDGPLVQQINKQLTELRAEDPGTAAKLDTMKRISVDGDAISLTITDEGLQYVKDVKQR